MMARHAEPLPMRPPRTQDYPKPERILRRVMDLPNGCQLWLGRRHQKTGPFIVHNGTQQSVARVMWFYKHGQVPRWDLRRTCDTAICVAPEHRR